MTKYNSFYCPFCQRYSADNEEMLHTLAQAMLIIAPGDNISPQQWLELNPNGVMYGSRRGLNVGAGGSALLLQMQESTALQAALTKKEQQAIRLMCEAHDELSASKSGATDGQ